MTEELKQYESTIKKKISFGLTPKFEEEFRTQLNKTVFFPIAKEIIEKIGWDIVFEDDSTLEAKQHAEGFHWGQKITIKYQSGKVIVNSKSNQSPLFDFGRNSKRVKLFIYAFQNSEKSYDKISLKELEEKTIKANNLDDYEIPETLPQPQRQTKPKSWIPVIGGILVAIILGFLIAFMTAKVTYVIGIYEVAIGFLIGFSFKYFIKLSNYTNFDKLNYLLIGMVLLTYSLNQYFLYVLIVTEGKIQSLSFFEFIQLRFQEGLTIDTLNTGWIGLLVSWIFQIGFTYGIAYIQLASQLSKYQLEKVPMEVLDFAYYHFVKGKDENGVRQELSIMGWTKKEDQNDVFEAMSAIQGLQELNRMD